MICGALACTCNSRRNDGHRFIDRSHVRRPTIAICTSLKERKIIPVALARMFAVFSAATFCTDSALVAKHTLLLTDLCFDV